MARKGTATSNLKSRLEALNAPADDVALVEKIVQTMDLAKLDALSRRYADEMRDKPSSMYKYIEPVTWTYHKLKYLKQIGLHESKPLRIWDIGAGAAHFARVCRHFGHTVVSTDIDVPLYDEIAEALGETRVISAIEPEAPTPDLGGKFDLITAIAINFHSKPTKDGRAYWSMDDWKFLVRDLVNRQLNYPGRIWLRLNVEFHDGVGAYNPQVMDYFEGLGAEVDRKGGVVDWKLKKRPKAI